MEKTLRWCCSPCPGISNFFSRYLFFSGPKCESSRCLGSTNHQAGWNGGSTLQAAWAQRNAKPAAALQSIPLLAPRNLVSWENQGCRQMALKPNPGETPIVRFIGVPPSVAANTFRIYLEIKSAALILDQVFGVPSVPSLEVYHIHPTSQSALLHKSMMFFWTSPGGIWTRSLQGKSDDPFWRWLILFSNQVIDKEVKLLMQCFFNEKIHRKNQS